MRLKFIKPVKASITKKLILSYLLVVLIPILVSGGYIAYSMQKNIRKEFSNVIENHLRQLDWNITEKIDTCIQAVKAVKSDKNLSSFIQSVDLTDLYTVETINNDIVPRLNSIKSQNELIYNLRIIHGNPEIPTVYDIIYFDGRMNNGYWVKKLKELNDNKYRKYDVIYIETSHEEDSHFRPINNDRKKVFSIYYPIYSTYMDRIIGIIEIDILEDMLLEPLKKEDFKGYEFINLISHEGSVLYSSKGNTGILNINQLENPDNFMSLAVDNKSYHIAKIYINSIKSWLVFFIPDNLIYINNSYKAAIVIVLLLGLLTLGLISFILSRVILGKLMKLTHVVKKIKGGNLDIKVNIESCDEIGILANEFNEMTDQIKKLMINVEESNKAEKEAIYKALESQIKPHFLCNALDMIRMTAEVQNNKEISNAIELIMSYFMYNILNREKYVSIKDELKNVTDYIEIHNLIKKNRIQYAAKVCSDMSGNLNEYYVLKFTLQPVIENSIKHGFKDKYGNCHIFINIECKDETIIISMEDNGCGIPVEKIDGLNKYLDLNERNHNFKVSGSGIGLRNIIERLDINYGSNYGIEIDSHPGIGTLVTMRVPVIKNINQDLHLEQE